MANIHDLGLGILKLVTGAIEKDNNIELWNDIEPHAKTMLGDIFNNPNVEIHPLVQTGFQIFQSVTNKRQLAIAKLAEQKQIEPPKEEKVVEVNKNGNRLRGYNNI